MGKKVPRAVGIIVGDVELIWSDYIHYIFEFVKKLGVNVSFGLVWMDGVFEIERDSNLH